MHSYLVLVSCSLAHGYVCASATISQVRKFFLLAPHAFPTSGLMANNVGIGYGA